MQMSQKITLFSVQISLYEELKFDGLVEQPQKKTFSPNFKHYNLSICAVKVSKISFHSFPYKSSTNLYG